jgi:CheY-like chemotaxis protein
MTMENRTTVFYVDDNPKSSRLLSSVLEGCGFRVIAMHDPIEALSLCRRTSFDVALLDYEMPGMSGAQLAQEIKFLVPDVPVVMISGYAALPSTELVFVDAHFGLGTVLDDLLWSMRALTGTAVLPGPVSHVAIHRAHST